MKIRISKKKINKNKIEYLDRGLKRNSLLAHDLGVNDKFFQGITDEFVESHLFVQTFFREKAKKIQC